MDDEVRRGGKSENEVAVTLGRLQERMASLEKALDEKYERLEEDFDDKHQQNRRDIHNVRGEMQTMTDRFSTKLDNVSHNLNAFSNEVRVALAATKGEKDYKQWFFPTVVTLGLVIIGVLEYFKK